MFISTDAIILKNTPYKETSIISRLFSKEQGKISVIFKGAKRSKNNVAGIVEPGNIISITYYNKSNLKVSKEINLVKIYYNTRKVLEHYYYTMAIISILDKVCMEDIEQSDIYNLSVSVFDKINEREINTNLIFIYFLIQINKLLGFELPTDQASLLADNHSQDNPISIIRELHNSIDVLDNINSDLINKIDLINQLKIIIYKHMKRYVIDLNDIHAVNMLKQIKDERIS